MEFLKTAQYQHLALQMQELAMHDDPTHSDVLSVQNMSPEEFCELRDKGGILGGLNVRVFYGVDKDSRAIVVLGSIREAKQRPDASRRLDSYASPLA